MFAVGKAASLRRLEDYTSLRFSAFLSTAACRWVGMIHFDIDCLQPLLSQEPTMTTNSSWPICVDQLPA
jgi:hypothetical protein